MPYLQERRAAWALLLSVSCAPTHATYVAPSLDTVRLENVPSYQPTGFTIFVINDSSVPITVTSLTLRDCVNVRSRCDLMRLHVTVGPGSRVRVGGAEPANGDRDMGFRAAFTWEVAKP